MKDLTYFPEDRYKHGYSVGKRMYYYAKYKMWLKEKFCREMFVLGNIHDIGYEFDSYAFGHDIGLASTMEVYKYINEIRYHSRLQHSFDSLAMRLLYYGDSVVDGYGNWCTYEERLQDLEVRYGSNSEVYRASEDIIDYLKDLEYDDKFGLEEDLHI